MKIMNPKLAQATKKPLAAQRIKNAAPAGRPKSGIGMIGGPKPSIPTPVNPSPKRPPLKAAPVTGVTRGGVEQNYRGIPGLVNATAPIPNLGGAGTPQGQRTQSGSMAAMGGAATGMLKPFGAKKGGKVPSKMGAVKTSASRDGIAKKGKTKGRMV